MARRLFLLIHPITHATAAALRTSPVVAAATLVLCAIALLMCASHSRRSWLRGRWQYCCYNSSINADEPVIELNTEATILTTKRAYLIGGRGDEYNEKSGAMVREQSVWKKEILMGKKCQLPDYSGTIIYDSAGQLVPPKPTTSRVAHSLQC